MDDLSVHINYLPCLHRRVVLDINGGMHFNAGEVWDDIQERLLCLDCLQYVTEAEARSAWHGFSLEISLPEEEVSHGNA